MKQIIRELQKQLNRYNKKVKELEQLKEEYIQLAKDTKERMDNFYQNEENQNG